MSVFFEIKDNADVSQILVHAVHPLRRCVLPIVEAQLRFEVCIDFDVGDGHSSEAFVVNHGGKRDPDAVIIDGVLDI